MRRLLSIPDPVNEVAARLVATGVVLMAVATLVFRLEWMLWVLAYGFVARVGHLAAPWMFLTFLACGAVMLGRFGTANLAELITPSAESSSGQPKNSPPGRFEPSALTVAGPALVTTTSTAPIDRAMSSTRCSNSPTRS